MAGVRGVKAKLAIDGTISDKMVSWITENFEKLDKSAQVKIATHFALKAEPEKKENQDNIDEARRYYQPYARKVVLAELNPRKELEMEEDRILDLNTASKIEIEMRKIEEGINDRDGILKRDNVTYERA